ARCRRPVQGGVLRGGRRRGLPRGRAGGGARGRRPSGSAASLIRTVLVANRGEIACRVFRACRLLSLGTVAVYSYADRESPHRRDADRAVAIGPPPARASYLDAERILAAAHESGADAIHPGYGFLSENWAFAEACRRAGIVFIGPSPEAIRRMGDKTEARRLMAAAGVPVVPGSPETPAGAATAARGARGRGCP